MTHSFETSYARRDSVSVPLDYTAQWIYADCDKIKIAGSSYHQVLRITTDQWASNVADYGDGTFRLQFGDYSTTPCLGYDITIENLKAALNVLVGEVLSVEKIFVEEHTYIMGESSLSTPTRKR